MATEAVVQESEEVYGPPSWPYVTMQFHLTKEQFEIIRDALFTAVDDFEGVTLKMALTSPMVHARALTEICAEYSRLTALVDQVTGRTRDEI